MRSRFLDDGEPLKGAAFEIAQGVTLGWAAVGRASRAPSSAPLWGAEDGARVRRSWSVCHPGLHPGLIQSPPLWGWD